MQYLDQERLSAPANELGDAELILFKTGLR